jgi:hypothetical protein
MARERVLQIRPFEDAYDEIWEILSGTTVVLGEVPFFAGRHTLSDVALRSVASGNPRVQLDLDLDLMNSLANTQGLALNDFRLSVFVSTQFMNLGFLAFSECLDRILDFPLTVAISDESLPASNPVLAIHTGFSVRCVLTLENDRVLDSKSLAPSKRHSIVSESSFRFSSASDEPEPLTIHQLDDDARATHHVPENTLIYISRGDLSPLEAHVLPDVMKIYVDAAVLDKLQSFPKHVETTLQKGLLIQAIYNEVILQSIVDISQRRSEGRAVPTEEDIKRTLLGTLLNQIVKKGTSKTGKKVTVEILLEELINNPSKLFARIQAVASLRDRSERSFGGND